MGPALTISLTMHWPAWGQYSPSHLLYTSQHGDRPHYFIDYALGSVNNPMIYNVLASKGPAVTISLTMHWPAWDQHSLTMHQPVWNQNLLC